MTRPAVDPAGVAESRGRALVALALLLIGVAGVGAVSGPVTVLPLCLAAGLVAVAVTAWGRRRTPAATQTLEATVIGLVLAGVVVSGGTLARGVADVGSVAWVATLIGFAVVGGAAVLVRDPARADRFFWLFLLVLAALALALFHRTGDPLVDTFTLQDEGARALLHGHNPYAISYTNPYDARHSSLFYGPGIVHGGRIDVGFPYLPVTLLAAVPGYVLGDVRVVQLVALLVTAVLLRRAATDSAGRWLAFVPLVGPGSMGVVEGAWVEPISVLLLTLVVLALRSQRRIPGALALGLLLDTKQYLVVTLPLLLVVARRLGLRIVLAALGIAAGLVLAFFVADPHEFWRAVVELQLKQPFRPDSTSLLVWSVQLFGWPPPASYGLLPLVAGLVAATAVAWRGRTATTYALGFGLSLLVTILLSKQAFTNYYTLVSAALAAAAVVWPADEAAPGDQSSGESAKGGRPEPLMR